MTVREFLTQEKESFDLPAIIPYKNGKNNHWPEIKDIRQWSEFDLKTLNLRYGHVLDDIKDSTFQEISLENSWGGMNINKENEIFNLIPRTDAIVGRALDLAKVRLNLYNGTKLERGRYRPVGNEIYSPTFHGIIGNINADHLLKLDDDENPNLVVGVVKASRKLPAWNVSTDINKNQRRALRQLAAACVAANTKYGYLQSERSILVCRFSFRQLSDECDTLFWEADVEFMPIPLSKDGPQHLTSDLALWWLTIEAMSVGENRVPEPNRAWPAVENTPDAGDVTA